MVNKTKEKGAKTVIGFVQSVYCDEVNIWATAFFSALADGVTVYNACVIADDTVADVWEYEITTDSWFIAGSNTQSFT